MIDVVLLGMELVVISLMVSVRLFKLELRSVVVGWQVWVAWMVDGWLLVVSWLEDVVLFKSEFRLVDVGWQ